MEATISDTTFEFLSFDKIKELHPDSWVLIGDPQFRNMEVQEAVVRKIIGGVLVSHGKDRRTVALESRRFRGQFRDFAFVWTGIIPQTRKFL